jgi:hypothetical protein
LRRPKLMHIVRVFRSGVVLAGLACFAVATLPGCGDESPPPGGQVKVDPAEQKKREEMIRDLYKSNPPAKGPGGKTAAHAKK